MIFFVLGLFTVALLSLGLIKPKLAALFIWPVLFTYPHAWWYYNVQMPLNIGFDDLFILWLFFSVLIHSWILKKQPAKAGWGFWIITAFIVLASIANFAGAYSTNVSTVYEGGRILYYRDIMKLWVFWGLAYTLTQTINSEDDLVRCIWSFLLASTAAAFIIIFQYYNPSVAKIFSSPEWLEKGVRVAEEASRTGGAFLSPNVAAIILAIATIISLAFYARASGIAHKSLVLIIITVLIIAILMTRSRTGILGFSIAIFLMAIISNNKRHAWSLIVALLLILPVAATDMITLILDRFLGIKDSVTGRVDVSFISRIEAWRSHWDALTLRDFLVGQGRRASVARISTNTHNTYVSLLVLYGISGIVWFLAAQYYFWRSARRAFRSTCTSANSIAHGIGFAMICWLVCGMGVEVIATRYGLISFIFLLVTMDRLYEFSKNEAYTMLSNLRQYEKL